MPPTRPTKAAADPPWVGPDLERLIALPEAARASLWDLLGPAVTEKVAGAQADARLERFRRLHDLPHADLARAVRVARHLVRRAAARDLDRVAFAAEIAALYPSPIPAEVLLEGYEQARTLIRRDLARALLAEHGAVVDGIEWRTDVVTSTQRTDPMRLPVALLTLRYREGGRRQRLTVQLLPAEIAELRRLCERMEK